MSSFTYVTTMPSILKQGLSLKQELFVKSLSHLSWTLALGKSGRPRGFSKKAKVFQNKSLLPSVPPSLPRSWKVDFSPRGGRKQTHFSPFPLRTLYLDSGSILRKLQLSRFFNGCKGKEQDFFPTAFLINAGFFSFFRSRLGKKAFVDFSKMGVGFFGWDGLGAGGQRMGGGERLLINAHKREGGRRGRGNRPCFLSRVDFNPRDKIYFTHITIVRMIC